MEASLISPPSPRAGGSSTGAAALVPPAAVRIVDLDAPLADLELPPSALGEPYRSLMVVARLNGEPLGAATVPVTASRVSRRRLAGALMSQLEAELDEACARRGVALPESLVGGVGVGRGGNVTPPASRSVTVVVTTCRNTARLERCLRSILASRYEHLEVIVVENRPGTGATRRLLGERFAGEVRVRYVEESRPGLSWARNAGLAAAEGELVAFTDDDVVVDPEWVHRAARAFDRAPDVACVTGLILPSHLETDSQLILEQFAAFSKGFDARVFRLPDAREEHPLLPYTPGLIGAGANTVVRADVARRLGGFDTDLGTGTPAAGGEDLDLYIRLLRGGHAVAYEPSAIVWHEHPDGSFRLRSQVYRYGVGLGATLTKQLARGPERLELLRSVPAGVRYAREPSSRKNAGKTDDYPHGLNWLERVGMLLGPAAYLASSAMRRLRRRRGVAEGADANAPAMHVHRAALSSGRSVDVVSFLDLGLAPPATADRRLVATGASTGALVVGATLACLIAPLAVALDMPAGVRFPVVLALVCLVPGTALVALVRGRAEPGLIVGLGLAATAVLAQTMLWLDAWSPEIALYALATLALPVLVSELDRGRRSVSTALRQAIDAMPPAAALHAAILSAAMGAWTLSLHGAELDQIAGIGLLSAMPPTYFLAVLLLLVGFAVAVNHSPAAPKTLGLYVVALVVVVHATTPLLYDHPRYMWIYNHLGVISLIAETGAVDRDVDIYNNWPAFFASNAWLSGVTGLSPGAYAPWAQLFFGLTSVAAMRFALRGVTADERLLWTAAWFFVLANWVAQDYLAPQALGFVLSLVVLGLCLRCSPRARSAGRREDLPPAPLSPRAAVVVGGLLYLAIVTSHQLSPLMLLASVLALALIGRRVPLWVPAAMALVEAWWVALALPYLSEHFSLLDFDLAASAAPSGYEPGDGLPGSQLVAYAARLEVVLMVALALAGVLRRWRAGHRDVVVGSLALAPLAVCLAQSYGGEGRFRVYLFALPWLCLLAAAAFIPLPRTRLRGGLRSWRLALASGAAAVCLLFSYFGLELINRVTADDVEAAVWFERHAPPDSLLVGVTPSFPRRLTADYARVHDRTHPGTPGLTDRDEGLRRGTLGPADLPRVESTLRGYGGRRKFLILTPSQERFGRLYGILPAGGFRTLGQALAASPSFRLVFRRERSSIFEYRPRSGRSS